MYRRIVSHLVLASSVGFGGYYLGLKSEEKRPEVNLTTLNFYKINISLILDYLNAKAWPTYFRYRKCRCTSTNDCHLCRRKIQTYLGNHEIRISGI